MPRLTKFGYMDNEELLAYFSDKRDASDVIEELCKRLESLMDDFPTCGPVEDGGHQDSIECPVCDAELMIEETGTGYRAIA